MKITATALGLLMATSIWAQAPANSQKPGAAGNGPQGGQTAEQSFNNRDANKDNFLVNHYDNADVQKLLATQATQSDKAAREKTFGELQTMLASDLSTLPLLQGKQIAVMAPGVKGAGDTLDASFKFRLGVLSK